MLAALEQARDRSAASWPTRRTSCERRSPRCEATPRTWRSTAATPQAFADLEADIARLGRLVDTLLAVAREDAAPPPVEPVDRAGAGARADGRRRPRFGCGADGAARVAGDPDALRRASRT